MSVSLAHFQPPCCFPYLLLSFPPSKELISLPSTALLTRSLFPLTLSGTPQLSVCMCGYISLSLLSILLPSQTSDSVSSQAVWQYHPHIFCTELLGPPSDRPDRLGLTKHKKHTNKCIHKRTHTQSALPFRL